jgi:hypothetical protein
VASLDDLRAVARRRDRLAAALSQAQFEAERIEQELRDEGHPEDRIQQALGGKPEPRLRRAPTAPPPSAPPEPPPRRDPPPRRVDLGGEGFWGDDDG